MSRPWAGALLMAALLVMTGCGGRSRPAPAVPLPAGLRIPAAALPPRVSAEADDPAWASAAVIDHLVHAIGGDTSQPLPPTRVMLLWEPSALHIRFIARSDEAFKSPFGTTRDALHYQGDVVEVFVDPVGDGLQYFEIQQSPAGGIFDQNTLLTAPARSDHNRRLLPEVHQRHHWPNPGYDLTGLRSASAVRRAGDGYEWIADFALPTAALRRRAVDTFGPMTLRMNFVRYSWRDADSPRTLVPQNWSPVVFGCPHQSPAAMGRVELVNDR